MNYIFSLLMIGLLNIHDEITTQLIDESISMHNLQLYYNINILILI